MGGEPEKRLIREYWTVQLLGQSAEYAHLIDDEDHVVAYGCAYQIQRVARYLNGYEHVLKVYGKFVTEMEKLDE